jgi:predicted  nucleic acid-binding Zn-ribbon protein
MLDVIEKLLILQDRDRKILKIREELANIPHERSIIESKFNETHAALDRAKHGVKQLESDRKKLELEVEAKKSLIEKYSIQQYQTKKNEEYRALAKEIETCKGHILQIEDQELELMEQSEAAQGEVKIVQISAMEIKRHTESRLADLAEREKSLQKELAELDVNREDLASAVEESSRTKYERLLKSKGGNVLAGIDHGVCGGCHMQLSRQTVVSCQAEQEIITCINCGRILYYTPDMSLVSAE